MQGIGQLPARQRVASLLRKAIYAGEYKPNQELSLVNLSKELDISRTPIREAFQILESEGLLELRMNKSAVVQKIDGKFITDQYEFRALLEGEAAYRAAERAMDVEELEKTLTRFCENLSAVSQEEFTEFNQRLHTSIWQAADNGPLYRSLMGVWNLPSIGKTVPTTQQRFASTAEHSQILQYIQRGDAEGARRTMKQHIRNSLRNTLEECGA